MSPRAVCSRHAMTSLPPETAYQGNLSLLDEPLTALFCSNRCPGDLILKTYDLARAMRDAGVLVIGGFQTPMERECGLAPFFVPVVVLVSWVIEPLLWPLGQRSPGRGCPGHCWDVRRCSAGATPLFSPERPPKTRTNFR